MIYKIQLGIGNMKSIQDVLKSQYESDMEAINDINMKLVSWCQEGKVQRFGQYLSSAFPEAEVPSEILEEKDSYIVFDYFVGLIEEIEFN